jgi:hypothetical protein
LVLDSPSRREKVRAGDIDSDYDRLARQMLQDFHRFRVLGGELEPTVDLSLGIVVD